MTQTTMLYNYYIEDSRICLEVKHHLVADYPISFTLRECLEDFCESVGWRLIRLCRIKKFTFERPSDVFISGTIYRAWCNYESGLVEETVF